MELKWLEKKLWHSSERRMKVMAIVVSFSRMLHNAHPRHILPQNPYFNLASSHANGILRDLLCMLLVKLSI